MTNRGVLFLLLVSAFATPARLWGEGATPPDMGIATCSIQGVLQIGDRFVSGEPAKDGLYGVPAHFIQVYYLQLPAPLGKQLAAQGIDVRKAKGFDESDYSVKMVDVGWPSNDVTYNPFKLNRKVGLRLRITGQAYTPYHAFSQYLSNVFLKAKKVEVLKNFDTKGW